jgi:hypothetical protein
MYRSGMSILEFLAAQIADPDTQWSVGTFGALAEFMREPNEPARIVRLEAVTARGAIRLTPTAEMHPFAFETATKEAWTGRIALCLPREHAAMSGRTVLTELGPDTQALCERDRSAILFDLGIGGGQVDCLIRVADPTLVERLRDTVGRPVFTPDSDALHAIVAASPHRVFVSRLGRIEVYQPIPPPDGQSPEGPHTHVLSDLLRHRRTHPATEPIPDGFVPCAYLYPAHPTLDAVGRPQPFDADRHARFQEMLRRYGDPETLAIKEQVISAVRQGADPATIPLAKGRFTRATVKVALRQIEAGA